MIGRLFSSDCLALLMVVSLSLISGCKTNAPAKKTIQGYPQHLPDFVLQDAHGKRYDSDQLKEKNLIIVVTVPNIHNKSAQEDWSEFLEQAGKSKDITLIFLEDMAYSAFKTKARHDMKKESKSGEEPILLIDTKGEVRKKLKAPANETLVLVYKKKGDLVHVETQEPSKASAMRIWRSLGVSR